jgi:hypothetical protein
MSLPARGCAPIMSSPGVVVSELRLKRERGCTMGSLDMPCPSGMSPGLCSCAEAMSTHMERRRADSRTGLVAVGSLRFMADGVIGGGMGAETFGNVYHLLRPEGALAIYVAA